MEGAAKQWMTPNVPNGGRSASHAEITGRTAMHNGKKVQIGLEHQAKTWASPRTITGGGETAERKKALGRAKAGGGDLQSQVEHWSTPRASDGEKGGPNMAFGAGGIPLPAQAANWPTPTLRDHKGGGQAVTRSDGKSRMDMLDWRAEHFQPSLPDQQMPSGPISSNGRLTLYRRYRATTDLRLRSEMRALLRMGARYRKNGVTLFNLRPRSFTPYVRPSFRRRLNPIFAEWLMGWPEGLSGFDTAAMASCPSAPPSPGCGCMRCWLTTQRALLSDLLTIEPPEQGELL